MEIEEDQADAQTTKVSAKNTNKRSTSKASRKSNYNAEPVDPMQVEKQFFKLLVLSELLNTPETIISQTASIS